VGITNLGNTCFLSAGLQCLSHVVPLTAYMLSGEYKADLNTGGRDGTCGRLAEKYEQLLRDLWFADSSSVSPSGIKSEMGGKDAIYRGLNQQDAHEFLERFLDWLQEDVNR
jgi:ubiquitin C-terminal hydrolase